MANHRNKVPTSPHESLQGNIGEHTIQDSMPDNILLYIIPVGSAREISKEYPTANAFAW